MKADKVEAWSIDRVPGEGPRHPVRITKPFRLGRHEVTRGQFRQFVNETGYRTEAELDGTGGTGLLNGKWVKDPRFVWNVDPGFPQTDDHPVVNVSWNDATAYCEWLSKKQGIKYQLPTEARWEYACRAGTTTFWHFGDSQAKLPEYAWFLDNAGQKTHPVGQLKPNAWGLHDMHANVFELCADRYAADYYAQATPDDPSGPTEGSFRVYRGGGWIYHAGLARSAFRHARAAESRFGSLGFRLASGHIVVADSADGAARAETGPVQWRVEDGGNGHRYDVVAVAGGITWEDAKSAAAASGGHLATIASKEENDFLVELIANQDFWIRSPQGWRSWMGPWLGGFQNHNAPDYSEPDRGWTWITGETWSYENWWMPPENGVGGRSGAEQDHLHFRGPGVQGPRSSATSFDDWIAGAADPPAWNDANGAGADGHGLPVAYLVEWDSHDR